MDLSPILCTRPFALAKMEGFDTSIQGTVRFYSAPGGFLIKAVFFGFPPQGADNSILDLTIREHIFPVVIPCGGHSFTVVLTDKLQSPPEGTPVVLTRHNAPSCTLAAGIIMGI